MFVELITWWYLRGWGEAWRTAKHWIADIQRDFSISMLVQTLFSPWKQITTSPGRPLNERLSAMVDNLISRSVGFSIRLIAILSAVLLIILTAMVGLVLIIIWPLLPLAIIYCLLRSVLG